jgi:hypothetical protein
MRQDKLLGSKGKRVSLMDSSAVSTFNYAELEKSRSA